MLLGLLSVCKPQYSQAQSFFGAAPEALGEAGRGAVNGIDSHYLNPAAIAFTQDYSVGATFQTARATLGNPENTTAFTVTDNSADKVLAGGFGYYYKRSSQPDRQIIDQDFSVSLAARFLQRVGFGVQGRRLFRMNNMAPGFTKHNITVGALVVPAPFIGFGLVGYDLLNDDDLDMVPSVGLGSHLIIMDIIRFRADVTRQEKRNPEKKGSLNLGMEINAGEGFQLRVGGIWDGLNNKTYWTTGLAWEGPKLSVAYALKNNASITDDTTHTFQAWLQF
jgi:hypothetical protein